MNVSQVISNRCANIHLKMSKLRVPLTFGLGLRSCRRTAAYDCTRLTSFSSSESFINVVSRQKSMYIARCRICAGLVSTLKTKIGQAYSRDYPRCLLITISPIPLLLRCRLWNTTNMMSNGAVIHLCRLPGS